VHTGISLFTNEWQDEEDIEVNDEDQNIEEHSLARGVTRMPGIIISLLPPHHFTE